MQIVVLLAFVLSLTLLEAPCGQAPGWALGLVMAAYLAGAAALGGLNTVLSLRAMGRGQPPTPRVLRRHNLMVLLTHLWLLGGLGGAIWLGYGRWIMEGLRLAKVPLAGELLALAPFLAGLVMTWALEYPFYAAMRRRIAEQAPQAPVRPGWTLGQYVGYNARHNLLFIAVPVSLIILAKDALSLYVSPLLPEGLLGDAAMVAGMAGVSGAIFLLAPLLIVRIWRTRRLPEGPLRSALEGVCRDLGLRYRDVLVWRTGGMLANAGVMGLLGRVRYILLSDALLERMDMEEIKAIFGHEAGHIRSHHILYSVVFAAATMGLCGSAGWLVGAALKWQDGWGLQALTLGLLGAVWAVGFGWLSRRFERQSDVIGAWVCGTPDGPTDDRITPQGAALFAKALERVARLNGIPLEQRNWRHGSIASRIAYILRMGGLGGSRQDVDRAIRRIKIGLWIALAAGAIAMGLEFILGGGVG